MWERARFARDYISSRLRKHGKLNSSESRRVPFSGNKEEKSGNVSRTERRKAEVQTTSSDPMLTTSRNKENGHTSLSPVIPSASNVFRSHVLFFIRRTFLFFFPVSSLPAPRSPALSEGLRVPDSFFLREPHPPFTSVTRSFYLRASSLFAICVFFSLSIFFLYCITIQASAFIAYSILACKIIYIYIRLNLVLKSKFYRTITDTAHIQYGTFYILYININDLSLVIVWRQIFK